MKRLSGIYVRLHHSKYILFRIKAVCNPTYTGYGTLFHSHFSTVFLNIFEVIINIWYIYCADIGADWSIYFRFPSQSFHKASIDSWLLLITCYYIPVLYRAFPSIYFPAEYIFIELFCSCNIICMYLKMDYSWRANYPLL